MKKSIKLLTLSLLATGMLAGCGGTPAPSAPDWSAEDKEAMRSALHGEVLPYVTGVADLQVVPGGLYVGVRGGEVSPETLASYSELYLAAGWDFLGSYKDPTTGLALSYNFEKEITTEEGVRYVSAQFGGINSSYQFVENGNFMLYAEDPYVYSWEDAELDVNLFVLSNFLSEEELPAPVECQHYEVGDNEDYGETDTFMIVKCYTDDDEAADKYYATLSAITGEHKWHVYPGQEDEDDGVFFYLADSPDGNYGIQYFYSEEQGCLILYIAEANYLYEFPQAQLNALLTALEATGSVPAVEGDRYRFLADYGAAVVYFDEAPAEPDCGFTSALESAGWTVRGYVESVKEYVADTADGKASVRYYYEANEEKPGGMLIIEVTEPAFVSAFPTEAISEFLCTKFYFSSVTQIDDPDMIPDVEGATQYIFNGDNARLGIFYTSEEADGGYGALLTAAGFTVSDYTEVENGRTIHYAFSPLYNFYGLYYFNYGIRYSYYEGALSVEFDYVDEFSYKTGTWSNSIIKEMFDINGYDYFEVPEFSSEQAGKQFVTDYYYDSESENMFVDVTASNVSASEISSYLSSLSGAGWIVSEGSSALFGGASKEFSELKGVGYIYWMTNVDTTDPEHPIYHFTVLICMDMGPIGFPEYPTDKISAFYEGLGFEDVPLGTFTCADPDAYFEIEEGSSSFSVYANGATIEEQRAFTASLQEAGWVIISTSEMYPDDVIMEYKPEGNETGIKVSIVDFTDSGYTSIEFYYDRPAEKEFPLTEVNSFLSTYDLGFSLTAGWEDPSGNGYKISSGDDGEYHYYKIAIQGEYCEAINDLLRPILESAGYSEKTSSKEGDRSYSNDAYHEVWIYTSGGITYVYFWE